MTNTPALLSPWLLPGALCPPRAEAVTRAQQEKMRRWVSDVCRGATGRRTRCAATCHVRPDPNLGSPSLCEATSATTGSGTSFGALSLGCFPSPYHAGFRKVFQSDLQFTPGLEPLSQLTRPRCGLALCLAPHWRPGLGLDLVPPAPGPTWGSPPKQTPARNHNADATSQSGH